MRTTASVSKNVSQPKPSKQPAAAPKDPQPSAAEKAENIRIETPVNTDEIPAETKTSADISGEMLFVKEKVPTKISTVMENGIAFIRNIAPDIVDNLVVGETPIVPIAIEMVEWAESNVLAGKLTGQEKKRVVINILLWLVDHQEDVFGKSLDYDKDQLKEIVQHVLPSVIDMVISASKGKILVNKFAKTSKTCIGICCPSA